MFSGLHPKAKGWGSLLALGALFLISLIYYISNKNMIKLWISDLSRSDEHYTLFIGSSSIHRLPVTDLVNCGISEKYGFNNGTTEDLARYLEWAVFKNVYSVVIYIGENDIARGKSVEQTFSEHLAIISRIKQLTSSPIGIITLKPSPARSKAHEKFAEFNNLLSLEYSGLSQVSLLPFHLFAEQSLYSSDGIHLNAKGARRLIKSIDNFCKEIQ